MFNGKTHYFDWAIFNSYVKLPEGTHQAFTTKKTKNIKKHKDILHHFTILQAKRLAHNH